MTYIRIGKKPFGEDQVPTFHEAVEAAESQNPVSLGLLVEDKIACHFQAYVYQVDDHIFLLDYCDPRIWNYNNDNQCEPGHLVVYFSLDGGLEKYTWKAGHRAATAAIGDIHKEGSLKQVTLNLYERSTFNRDKCIEKWGCQCYVCGLIFGEKYGEFAEGFIHVHHLNQLSKQGGERAVDPIHEMRPVCPNCHAMIHRHPRGVGLGTLDDLKRHLAGDKKG